MNYYKLDLGGQEYSWVLGIEILDLSNDEVLVQPNPSDIKTQLVFANDSNQEIVIAVMSAQGTIFQFYYTNQSFFELETQNWPTGMYYFSVTKSNSGIMIPGKIVVFH